MTLEEARRLFEHWGEEPPLVDVGRALAGWEPKEPTQAPQKAKELNEDEYQRVVAGMRAQERGFKNG